MMNDKKKLMITAALGALLSWGTMASAADTAGTTAEGADEAITAMKALGFVDTDGSKLKAIAFTYDREIPASAISKDTFQVKDYGTTLSEKDLTQGKDAGVISKVYVNSSPAVSKKGTASGRYVIIEVYRDYQTGRFPRSYKITMAASVKQVKDIQTEEGTILPSKEGKKNSVPYTYISCDPQTGKNRAPEQYDYAVDGTYTIDGLSGYELHTIEKGSAFRACHCFDEANGKYWDFDLPYALYVPKDYNPSGKYGLGKH